jgi:hypothetical protein
MKAKRSKNIDSGRPRGTRGTVFLMLRMCVSGSRFDGFVQMTGK